MNPTVNQSTLTTTKNYSLRQSIDLIYDVMENKRRYDEKITNKPETLEGYLIVYCQHKYGLKDLALAEVKTIIDIVNNFAPKSLEIETFTRIWTRSC